MIRLSILAVAGVSLAAVSLPAQAQAQAAGDKIAGSYICVFKKGAVSRGSAQAEANRAAQAGGARVTRVYSVALQGFAANMSAQAVAQMQAANPNIAYCEQDQVASTPPIRIEAKPGSGGGAVQETPWGIARVNGGGTTSSATAWVIDTGVDLDHPDLNVDVARSRNFVERDTSPEDLNGHGTHVAGTIAALNNTIGVIGVVPGTKVVAVRVLDRRGSGTISGVIAGVDYVAQYGQTGDVANMSLGGGASQSLDDAVLGASSKVRFAVAAGNDSANANNYSPARVNGPNVYTVSSFAIGDKWSSFSNYGNPPIDYAEPGSSIKSTWKDGGYNTISGTSMATPHLAGLLLSGGLRTDSVVSGDPDGNPDPIGEM